MRGICTCQTNRRISQLIPLITRTCTVWGKSTEHQTLLHSKLFQKCSLSDARQAKRAQTFQQPTGKCLIPSLVLRNAAANRLAKGRTLTYPLFLLNNAGIIHKHTHTFLPTRAVLFRNQLCLFLICLFFVLTCISWQLFLLHSLSTTYLPGKYGTRLADTFTETPLYERRYCLIS